MGGLNRNKDYGSKKKPYPSVAKKILLVGIEVILFLLKPMLLML